MDSGDVSSASEPAVMRPATVVHAAAAVVEFREEDEESPPPFLPLPRKTAEAAAPLFSCCRLIRAAKPEGFAALAAAVAALLA